MDTKYQTFETTLDSLLGMQCKVCTTQYNMTLNKPLILECGHTFCSKCLYK